jgi:tRNA dimethylallyltransferase
MTKVNKKRRWMIAGPTASGKSSLAIELAKKTGGEIISVDSRQCYKRLDIGTAKPGKEEMNRVRHHNISVLELTENDSAAAFMDRVKKYEMEIEIRGNSIIYCGGSTLHLQSILRPLDEMPTANSENVQQLNDEVNSRGINQLYEQLLEVDPEYAEKMDGMNPQRIIRALDVWMQTGKPFSSFHQNKKITPPENLEVFILHHPRAKLHKRISDRTDQMIKRGLIDETVEILSDGYSPELQSFNTVGYKEVIACLKGDISQRQMAEDIKTSTRRYAKRQITWFRKWEFAYILEAEGKNSDELAEEVLEQVAAEPDKG